MVKNWLILGDEAFDSDDFPMGIMHFSLDEMKDWQSIAWKQFADIFNNNERVRNMVFNCNLISISGLFYKKSGVILDHLKEFARAIADECDNIEYGRTDIDYDTRKDTNMLFVSFLSYDPDMVESKTMEFNYIVGDYMMPIQVRSDSMSS